MCGLAGVVSLDGRPLRSPGVVQKMADRLLHRGPDEEGHFINGSRTVSLAHRRLRIIDLATGRQPITNEDGSVVVVFNGEIYNFQPLRRRLQQRGHRFSTNTDTEVIVHLYEEEGLEVLRHLKGMFALILWDERAQRLLAARDPVGKKPLYYASHEGAVWLASELDALRSVPGLSRELDELALDQYLTFGYIPAPRTIFRAVKKVPAGESLVLADGLLVTRRYWIPRPQTLEPMTWEEKKEVLLSRLRTATAARMISDVPIGCFVSGGLDSSAVLWAMAEVSPRPVQTFSIGFPEQEHDELAYARAAARHFGTDHHEYVLEPEATDVLDDLVRHFGEPFADAAALPTWYLSKLARKSVTVALTGDGGDELFGGYGWYRTSRWLTMACGVPTWTMATAAKLTAHLASRTHTRLMKAMQLMGMPAADQHAALRTVLATSRKEQLYTADFLSETHRRAAAWLANEFQQVEGWEPGGGSLNHAMATDLVTYLPEDLLVKIDRMSMAHSMECRSPLLDTDLIEWSLGLPWQDKLSWRQGKLIVRETMRGRLPDRLLDRPKHGFTVPLSRWFRDDLQLVIRDRVLEGVLERLGVFRRSGLQTIVQEHAIGAANHEHLLWSLLVLASWAEQYAI